MLEDQIRRLDDDTAVRILETAAGARWHAEVEAYQTELTPELAQALRDAFVVASEESATAGRGDLAREALVVLAADPQQRPALEAFVQNPSATPTRMALLEFAGATAVITAALIALQTRAKIQRDKQGNLTWSIEVKPTDLSVLKPLVEKLLSLIP